MSAFRRRLDKSKPFAEVIGNFHGARFKQGPRYFDGDGDEIEVQGVPPVDEMPSSVDQSARIKELLDKGHSVTEAAAIVQAEIDASAAELEAWKQRQPGYKPPPVAAPTVAPTPAPGVVAVVPGSTPPAPATPPATPGPVQENAWPTNEAGEAPWDWAWNEMLGHFSKLNLPRPPSRVEGNAILKKHYGQHVGS